MSCNCEACGRHGERKAEDHAKNAISKDALVLLACDKDQLLSRITPNIRIDKVTGCWLFHGRLNSHGYGRVASGKKGVMITTHRGIAFAAGLLSSSNIDMCVLHHCDVRNCVNPSHLFIGTQLDNARDRDAKGRLGPRAGECDPRAKLRVKDVLAIRSAYLRTSKNRSNTRALAAKYGVNRATIQRVISGERWSVLMAKPVAAQAGGVGDAE